MSKSRLAAQVYGILMSMNSSEFNMFRDLTLDEMIMAMDEKIMSITLGLTFEIRKLVDQGYSYEQISELIQNIKFNEENNISDRESNYIKKDARKTLKLIINNTEKEND